VSDLGFERRWTTNPVRHQPQLPPVQVYGAHGCADLLILERRFSERPG
jgi:hypothetical protein